MSRRWSSRVRPEYQHVDGFNHGFWSAFVCSGALKLGLASLEFGVREQHEGGIGSQPGPGSKLAQAVARFLRDALKRGKSEAGCPECLKDVGYCGHLRCNDASGG